MHRNAHLAPTSEISVNNVWVATVPLLNSDPPRTRRGWVVPLVVGILCSLIYLLTAAYSDVSGDVRGSNVLSWQVATTGSSTYTEDTYPPMEDHPLRDSWIAEKPDGSEVIGRLPGAVIAAIPAYFLLGGNEFSLGPGSATAAVLTAISVFLFATTLRGRLRRREVALSSLTFGLATPVWSVAADGLWTHTITVLGICGMAWAANKERWWLVGLFGGIAIWGRLHVAIIVALFGLLVGIRRRDVGIVLRVGLGSGIHLALQSAWTKCVYGSWNPASAYGLSVGDNPFNTDGIGLVNQLGFWVSPDRGLLVWSPIIILLVPAMGRNWGRLPDWSRALVWGGLIYTLLQGMRGSFGGGDAFYGYRLTLELLTCAAPALALSAHRMGRYARMAFGPVLVFQALVISVGAIMEKVASSAEKVWTTHTLLSALAQQPVALIGFLVGCLGIGFVAQRIWNDPRLKEPVAPAP